MPAWDSYVPQLSVFQIITFLMLVSSQYMLCIMISRTIDFSNINTAAGIEYNDCVL